MPRNSAPNSAPIAVPSPPASSVPPMTAADTARNIVSAAPAVSGVTEVERIASSTPTNPARVLQRMKLRMTTKRTLMPASAAPCLLPPTETVYMPQRVSESSTCTAATMISAQISSEYLPAPKMLANVPTELTCSCNVIFCPLTTCVTFTVWDVTSAPGMATGWACEMISVKPPTASSMPSVVMNDDTPRYSVKKPLMTPTTAEHTRHRIRHRVSPIPHWLNS